MRWVGNLQSWDGVVGKEVEGQVQGDQALFNPRMPQKAEYAHVLVMIFQAEGKKDLHYCGDWSC